jgi:heavy metal sensor kinase
MKLRSLRLRLALLAAALAGVSIAAFGATAWWTIRDSIVGRVDTEIRARLAREMSRPHPSDHWRGWEEALRTAFRVEGEEPASAQTVAFIITSADGALVHRSAGWPAGLRPESLPQPVMRQEPRRPPEFPRPEFGADRPPLRFDEEPPRPRPFAEQSPPRVASVQSPDGRVWRFAAMANHDARAFLGVDTAVIDAQMHAVRNALLLAFPLSLALVALGAWLLSDRALAPVRRLTASIRGVTAQGLHRRLTNKDADVEFTELLEVFNRMLERLERSFQQASRFSSDAAHELKTPLAILQGEIERAMANEQPGSPAQRQFAALLDEVRRLHGIVHKLLLLSRADAGRMTLARHPFDLCNALSELAEDIQLLAPGVKVDVQVDSGVTLNGDADLLKQALQNLVGNAVKYNSDPAKGWIRVRAARQRAHVRIEIANSSQGIAPAHREKIFERFFRADPARGRGVDGLGLGLPLAREIARAHGGDLSLARSPPGEVAFVLALPA